MIVLLWRCETHLVCCNVQHEFVLAGWKKRESASREILWMRRASRELLAACGEGLTSRISNPCALQLGRYLAHLTRNGEITSCLQTVKSDTIDHNPVIASLISSTYYKQPWHRHGLPRLPASPSPKPPPAKATSSLERRSLKRLKN